MTFKLLHIEKLKGKKMQNKTILITGAASGLGYMLAEKLLQQQAIVVAVDINADGLAKMKADFSNWQENIFTYVCDLSQKAKIDLLSKKVLKQHKVDVLVNNAGIVSGKPFLEINEKEIDKTMSINLMANIWLTKAFLPSMVDRKSGQVVFISSAAGIIGVNKLSDYCAAKFGIFGFAESLRVEMKKIQSPVKISIVAPYYIKTGMFEGVQTRFSFLLPLLEPEYAVKKIFQTIQKKKDLMIMPVTVRLIWPLRLLGTKIFDFAANLLGVNETMAHFVGRQPAQPKEPPSRPTRKKAAPAIETKAKKEAISKPTKKTEARKKTSATAKNSQEAISTKRVTKKK